jgi:Uma2 family endonuclease
MTTVQIPGGVTFTHEDWINLAQQDGDHRYELVDGNIIIMNPPPSGHAVIITRLIAWLIRSGYEPEVILADAGLAVGPNGRVPDLMLLHHEVPPMTPYLHPGDIALAIEVVSPSSRHDDREVKPVEYAAEGVEQFWRVEGYADPAGATVFRYRLESGQDYVLMGQDRLYMLMNRHPEELLRTERS